MIRNVVILGAGNLATQLALALDENGIQITQVYSRTSESAQQLAEKVNASFTSELSKLDLQSDLYVLAVKDSAIPEVLENLPFLENQFIVHTAGSVPMNVIEVFTSNYGVFYPLQTFSKIRKVDFSVIPICIEANHPGNLIALQELAEKISGTVHQINSEERKSLHLAAVFVNNFVNHFYTLGAEILQDKKLDFSLLKPLIQETAAKIEHLHPIDAQTGPAKRDDQEVIQAQLKLLQNKPEFKKIYSFVTESIFQYHQNQKHDLF